MITYFKEILKTLKQIEKHLALLASCVKRTQRNYGDKISLSTKHWNDK